MKGSNARHYHIWPMADGGRIYYRLSRAFARRQNASKYSDRHYGGIDCMIKACDCEAGERQLMDCRQTPSKRPESGKNAPN